MHDSAIEIVDTFSKPKWKLYVEKTPRGDIQYIYTGWYGGRDNKPYVFYNKQTPDWEGVSPFAFKGSIRPGSSYRGRSSAGMYYSIDGLVSRDGNSQVEMHVSGIEQMMKDLVDGKCYIKDGAIHGTWSFKKGGANVFMIPYNC